MARRVKKEEADLASAQTRRDGRGSKAKLGWTRSRAASTRRSSSSAWPSAPVAWIGGLYSRREILQSEIDEQLARVRQDRPASCEAARDLAVTELVPVDVARRHAADEVRHAERPLDALEVKARTPAS